MTYGITRLRQAGFEPSCVFWHQGEADALYGTSADEYTKRFPRLLLTRCAILTFERRSMSPPLRILQYLKV